MSDTDSVSPERLAARLRAGEELTVLDVRDRDEFEAWHIEAPSVRAVQVPHARFIQARVRDATDELAADHDLEGPVVVVCGRGEASAEVAAQLADAGVDAANLEGGMDAWARVYDRVELDADAPARLFQYQRPSSGCLAYLVVSDGEAAVVDPLRAFADRYVADASELGARLVAAVDTHVHADHVSGVRDVARTADADTDVVLPDGARERGLAFEARLVGDGDEIRVGDVSLSARATPGHTTEMTAYRVDDVILAGDSVFLSSVARPDLERGDDGAEALARTLHATLESLVNEADDDLLVAPGHYSPADSPAGDGSYTATVSELRERVPALGLDEAAFVDRVAGELPPRPANHERILDANLGRERVDGAEAFELELGPNNCAVAGAD